MAKKPLGIEVENGVTYFPPMFAGGGYGPHTIVPPFDGPFSHIVMQDGGKIIGAEFVAYAPEPLTAWGHIKAALQLIFRT